MNITLSDSKNWLHTKNNKGRAIFKKIGQALNKLRGLHAVNFAVSTQ